MVTFLAVSDCFTRRILFSCLVNMPNKKQKWQKKKINDSKVNTVTLNGINDEKVEVEVDKTVGFRG
ncbi:hypothetical protein CHY_1898 [Carboxydothermus hydrogenoformans Z-2901]|uniref:Uncharacterized protein n=1 Tax=Carboxydothermus hydrogenoformans (strain ATCC BAA-161 / DSM 6008 / Z-2901) TaxID=246194 RepID=Q3AAW6_CARHZ|nr:hypothetical protein CHY_1898 [Carboxydothermus hydrogenoformans Z-2901]